MYLILFLFGTKYNCITNKIDIIQNYDFSTFKKMSFIIYTHTHTNTKLKLGPASQEDVASLFFLALSY